MPSIWNRCFGSGYPAEQRSFEIHSNHIVPSVAHAETIVRARKG